MCNKNDGVKMNIPKYIQQSQSYIALSNQAQVNHSSARFENNQWVFDQTEEIFLYMDNYEKDLNIHINNNANIKLFLISYNSREIHRNLNVHVDTHGLLKLFSNYMSKRPTKMFVQRDFYVQASGSLILLNQITYRGFLSLNENIYLKGETANLDIDLLNLASDDDQVYIDQHVYHQAKRTYSQIHNWLIANGDAKLNYVVNGTIEKGYEKSDCQQLNKGIILSDKGEIKVIPTLYIDEYDVKAGHGAAIGQIDENQLFYLKSRGLDEVQAKNLIISGYINPFITKIKHNKVESLLQRRVQRYI